MRSMVRAQAVNGSTMRRTPADLMIDMAQVAAGDRAAFARLYDATAAKIYGVVLTIVKRRDLTDDIVQDVYVKVWQRAADYDPARASPVTWLVAIARNRALDEVRRSRPAALDETPEALHVADPARSAFDLLALSQDGDRLRTCLGALDPIRAELVRLAYLEGLTREVLSARFGHPVATIKTWLHRSLKQLKDCLGS